MRKVVLKMHVSLDGSVRAVDGEVMDWGFEIFDEELMAWELEGLRGSGVHRP